MMNAILARQDGYHNSGTGLGVRGFDKTRGTHFFVDVVSSEEGINLWRGDPIGARIVEVVPKEATRQGFDLHIGDDDPPDRFTPPDVAPVAPAAPAGAKPGALPPTAPPKKPPVRTDGLPRYMKPQTAYARNMHRAMARARRDAGETKPIQELITKQLADLEAIQKIRECMNHERAGGGSALLVGANDYTTDMRIPLDLTKVRGLNFLTPLEARELIPLYYYNDPFAPKYGQVAIYQLVPFTNGASVDGYTPRVTQIHESRLIVFPGIRVSRRIMFGACAGWGDSVFTRCAKALERFETGYQNADVLLSDFAQAVYKIKGLADAIVKDPNALTDSMMNVELGRSIVRAVVIDADESFERQSTSLAGFPDMLDRFAANLASAADMPLTLMMGQSPGGLNATGDSDIRFFYDRIASIQMERVAPALLRLVEILLSVAGENPDTTTYSVTFKPLWQATELEQAQARLAQMQTDIGYVGAEILSPEEVALSRWGNGTYSYDTKVDFEARAAQESMVAPTVDAKPTPTPTLPPAPNAYELANDPNEPGPTPDAAKVSSGQRGTGNPGTE